MNDAPVRASATLEIINRRGLHARASAKFCECAEGYEAAITVTKGSESASGISLMALVTLAAGQGSFIEIEAVGPDAETAIAALCALVNSKFGEP